MVNDKRHILIAEDDCLLLCSMRFALRCGGYHVTMVTNGVNALQKIIYGSVRYDLLVTDVQMPLCNGIQLLDNLKRERISIPVIAISAYDDYHTMKCLSEKGCRCFIGKPFSSTELKNCIDNLLQLRSTI